MCSFKDAAKELSVTPGAISQQIRGLEDDLGVQLFTRAVRSVTLTEAGRRLQPALTTAFLQIKDAVDHVRPQAALPLRVEAGGPVITKWLLPRLHRFSEQYPDLQVTIGTALEIRPCGEREVILRFSESPGEGVFALKLCEEYLMPLASPELIARLDLNQPKDLVRAPLLHHVGNPTSGPQPDWASWFTAAGLDPAGARRGMHFDPRAADHALDAAVSGAGVVLGRRFLARLDMAEGRLVMPFGPVLPMHINYYVLCKEGEETDPDIAAMINWISSEAAATADAAALDGGIGVLTH